MKKLLFFILILTISAALFAQQKYALVIGNGTYTGQPWGNLKNSINDAADMKTALESLGFQVEYINNGNLSKMQTAVINLKQKLKANRNSYGFFYYAGHGAQDRNLQNYLIPVDADTPSLNLLPQRALPVQFVMDELEEAKNELNMIVLDACRDVPALDRSSSRGLSVMGNIPRGSIVMYATAANKTASDGTGKNGLFTSHLLKNLTTAGLSVNEIFTRTGADVARASNGDQYPEIRQMYHETAYLGSRPAVVTQVTTPTVQPSNKDIELAKTHYNKGIEFYKHEEWEAAIREFSEAIKKNPNSSYYFYSRGNTYLYKKDYDRAIADFSEAIRINPNNASAFGSRGNAYNYTKEYDRAIADLSESIRINPIHLAYLSRGNIYLNKGENDRAIADYSEAIKLNPNDANAYHNRGNAYRAKGDTAKADADAKKAKELGYK